MPYKNIHFVKIKMELFEDHKFLIQLNDRQKGLYIMLLGLAGKTNNRIPNDAEFIKGRLALKQTTMHEIESDLKRISEVFPKFHLENDFWMFEDFDKEHNQILSKSFGISLGYPKDTQRMDKNRIEKNRNRIEKNKNKSGAFAPPTETEVLEYFEKTLKGTKQKALRFYQFYGSKDWFVGKNRMKNWHLAAARSMEWSDGSSSMPIDDDVERVRAALRNSKGSK